MEYTRLYKGRERERERVEKKTDPPVWGMGAFQESHPENRSFKRVHLQNYQLTTVSRPEVVVMGAHRRPGTQITLHHLHTLTNALKCVSEP